MIALYVVSGYIERPEKVWEAIVGVKKRRGICYFLFKMIRHYQNPSDSLRNTFIL